MIVDDKDPIFSTEPIVDVTAEIFAGMQSQGYINRQKFGIQFLAIRDRYNFENKWCEHYAPNYRHDWTPKQKRRIRKQTNKWRRRFLGKS